MSEIKQVKLSAKEKWELKRAGDKFFRRFCIMMNQYKDDMDLGETITFQKNYDGKIQGLIGRM